MSQTLTLSSTIRRGIVNLAGKTPESHKLVEVLLEEDRKKHHCFYGRVGFHNHLNHHLLAAYDLGAPVKVLQAIYDTSVKGLRPIDIVDKGELEAVTEKNWTNFLGQEKYYSSFLALFTSEIVASGTGSTLEKYIFSTTANGNNANMLLRFVSGAVHPLIQTGYAAEFGSDAMVAQALGQAAVHSDFVPELFDFTPSSNCPQPISLFEILRQVYDSPILKPVMPYDPDALLSSRIRDACKDGRPEEIKRLVALWFSENESEERLEKKIEELFWVSTLLMAGCGKPGRKPRLDFFVMHILNATLFLPSLAKVIPTMESKVKLFKAFLPVILMLLITRGRPRIDAELIMTYTATPLPPGITKLNPDSSALGDPNDPEYVNPWPAIIASVIHAPEAHIVKAIRALYYAAQKYGHTAPGSVPGALKGKEETHKGIAKVDGTVFIRAAGVAMDSLGWVTHGQKEGSWDRSALGWDDAWNGDD